MVDSCMRHTDGPRIYGGLRLYAEGVTMGEEAYWWPLTVLVYLIDLPLSVVADTLILPFIVPYDLSTSHEK